MQCLRRMGITALGVAVALAFSLMQTNAMAGSTVISMPPPPKITKPAPPQDLEAIETPADVVTWLDRAREADVSGNQRSYLGVVALTRYAKYKSGPRYTYYSPVRSGYYSNVYYTNYFPFDVSFLHGWPIWTGYSFPWVGFGSRFCW